MDKILCNCRPPLPPHPQKSLLGGFTELGWGSLLFLGEKEGARAWPRSGRGALGVPAAAAPPGDLHISGGAYLHHLASRPGKLERKHPKARGIGKPALFIATEMWLLACQSPGRLAKGANVGINTVFWR